MIKEFEFYHGVVFSKLIHGSEKEILIKQYPTESNASYVLNNDIGLYIKHSTKRMSPWRFSLQKIHQDEILEMKNKLREVFIILVCGEDGLVTLSFDELKKILNDVHGDVEWISATRNPRKEYTVKGSDGSLGRKVGKSDFPKKILEADTQKNNSPNFKTEYSWEPITLNDSER
jgi:hypothetical protein